MEDCIDIIQQLLKKAMEAIRKGDAVVAETVFKNKKKMHKAEKKYSKAHLNRVKNEVCDASMIIVSALQKKPVIMWLL